MIINKVHTNDYHNIVEVYLGVPRRANHIITEDVDQNIPIKTVNIFVSEDTGMFRRDIEATVQEYKVLNNNVISMVGIDKGNNRVVDIKVATPDNINVTVKTEEGDVEMKFTNGKQLKFAGDPGNILNILKPEDLKTLIN